jgi:hypothetical protein
VSIGAAHRFQRQPGISIATITRERAEPVRSNACRTGLDGRRVALDEDDLVRFPRGEYDGFESGGAPRDPRFMPIIATHGGVCAAESVERDAICEEHTPRGECAMRLQPREAPRAAQRLAPQIHPRLGLQLVLKAHEILQIICRRFASDLVPGPLQP